MHVDTAIKALVELWSLNYTLPEYFKAFASSVGIGSFWVASAGRMPLDIEEISSSREFSSMDAIMVSILP